MHVIGTAGHVDHGKSALITALTGTNPDRLIEERERGMTLDLGFAHLRYDDGVEAGIVDVPGHERFLHNMLAGAAGMELLLLVVDANEGAMPQTIEHLQILQFLNVRKIVVVVSKIDLVEPPQRDAALERIREQLQGTIAANAPMLAVSAQTGENLDALRERLHDELIAMPPRNAKAPVYLPIDRVFTLPGLGTVVTGTLIQGSIESGETLAIEPGGRRAHVRGIGVFDSTVPRVEAGSRVALNLAGLDRREIERGDAIAGAELTAARDVRVRFVPLQCAQPLLRRKTPVRAYIGSAEILGTLVADDDAPRGQEMRARLHLREPAVAFPGLRFVLRRPSPMTLLGGGYVEGIEQPEDAASHECAVLAVLRAANGAAVEPAAIATAANLREAETREALERLVASGDALAIARPHAYVDGAAAAAMLENALALLDETHGNEPWAMGTTSIALSRAAGVDEALLVRVLARFVEEGRLTNRGGYYAKPEFAPAFTGEQRAFFDRLVPAPSERPLLPVTFAEAAAAVKAAKIPGAARAFETMLARGAFVRVGSDLYRGSQIAQVRERVEALLRERGRMTAAEFRDLLGTSRKYAVPLLEWLDARGITIRDGDLRMLRSTKGGTPA